MLDREFPDAIGSLWRSFLGVHEAPDRPVINLETTLGKFDHKPAQGEVLLLRPLQQPSTMLARNRLRLVLAHLTRRNATCLSEAPHPENGCVDAHAELHRRPAAGRAARLNRYYFRNSGYALT
jgi:hypothetical protein